MRCGDCSYHTDGCKGEEITIIGDKHWLHLASVPSERLCSLNGRNALWLVGSFAVGTKGREMQEQKVPGCPYVAHGFVSGQGPEEVTRC